VWAQWTNAHGGIDGHPVKLIQADDQADPSKALSAANQFVASNAAAVTSGTANDPVIAPVLQAHRVPALGGFESSAPDGTNPFFFTTGTTPAAQGPGIMRAGRLLGGTKVGIPYCTEVASCKQTLPLLKAGAQQAGLAWVWQGAVSGSQPDYSAACLAAQSAGANLLYFQIAGATAIRFAQDCAKNHFTPHYIMSAAVLTPSMLPIPAMQGSTFLLDNIPYYANVPALNDFHAALQQYDPSFLKNPEYSELTVMGWIAGEQLAAAVRAANVPASKPVTSATVLRGLYALRGTTLGGLTTPLSYKPDVAHPNACYYLGQIKGGKATVLNGAKPYCP